MQHAQTREQFGRPIGGFQSIKHQLARVVFEIESVRASVEAAAHCHDASDEESEIDLVALASICQAHASEALLESAKVCVQVHGAIGFTWEHDASLFFKRASASMPMLGHPSEHREALAGRALSAPIA